MLFIDKIINMKYLRLVDKDSELIDPELDSAAVYCSKESDTLDFFNFVPYVIFVCSQDVTIYESLDGESITELQLTEGVNKVYPLPFFSTWNSFKGTTGSNDFGKGITKVNLENYYGDSLVMCGCSDIKEITLPQSVTTIPYAGFYLCTTLTSFTMTDSVISIGDEVFERCFSLASIRLSNNITSIPRCTFEYCSSLTGITIPDSVTTIGDYAFSNCSKLTSVTLGNSITSIGEYVFYNCSKLTSVTLGNSVTSIGNYAFYNCSSLTGITYNGTTSQWNSITKGNNWHYNVPSATVVTCTDGTVALS